jgi:hypothetical protein
VAGLVQPWIRSRLVPRAIYPYSLGLPRKAKFVTSYDLYKQSMSHNRFPDGHGGKNTVDGNIFYYIRIVVLDINLEDVELEMLNL